jgi:hypothetical protein
MSRAFLCAGLKTKAPAFYITVEALSTMVPDFSWWFALGSRLPGPKKDKDGKIMLAGDMLVFAAGFAPIYGKQILFFKDPVFLARSKVSPPRQTDTILTLDMTFEATTPGTGGALIAGTGANVEAALSGENASASNSEMTAGGKTQLLNPDAASASSIPAGELIDLETVGVEHEIDGSAKTADSAAHRLADFMP